MNDIIAKNLLIGNLCSKCKFYHRTWPSGIKWTYCIYYDIQTNNTCEKFELVEENSNLDQKTQ